MTLANILTIIRIFLMPLYLLIFFSAIENRIFIAGGVFLLAGLTDILDGYIARNYDQATTLGAILDPLADKLMTFAVLISLTWAGLIPPWILLVLGLKELVMIIGGAILYLFKGNQHTPANYLGKIGSFLFYPAAISALLNMPEIISRSLFYATVLVNILAFINYLIIYLKKTDLRPNK